MRRRASERKERLSCLGLGFYPSEFGAFEAHERRIGFRRSEALIGSLGHQGLTPKSSIPMENDASAVESREVSERCRSALHFSLSIQDMHT